MENEHKYRVVAWWTSGQTGIAKSDSAPNAIHFTAPPQFGGLEGRWTPEDLLMTALASCFTTTFHAIAGYSKFEYTDSPFPVLGPPFCGAERRAGAMGWGRSLSKFGPSIKMMRSPWVNPVCRADTSWRWASFLDGFAGVPRGRYRPCHFGASVSGRSRTPLGVQGVARVRIRKHIHARCHHLWRTLSTNGGIVRYC